MTKFRLIVCSVLILSICVGGTLPAFAATNYWHFYLNASAGVEKSSNVTKADSEKYAYVTATGGDMYDLTDVVGVRVRHNNGTIATSYWLIQELDHRYKKSTSGTKGQKYRLHGQIDSTSPWQSCDLGGPLESLMYRVLHQSTVMK